MNKKSSIQSSQPSKLAIIGFCYDENSSFMRGSAGAPPLIREALFSEASNLWSETGIDLETESLIFDVGDVRPAPDVDMFAQIEKSISHLLDEGFKPISLGGDHSITYPIIRAVARKHQALSLLHFDAHPDLYDEFQNNRHSHASPFARIMEEKLVNRLVQVGIRTMNGHQRDQAEKFGVEVIEMRRWQDDLALDFDSPLYISFDMDALDPAFAPGVSHREPGGLSVRQVLDVIHALKASIIGADIVEFNPQMDSLNITGVVCAKLLKEIAAKMLLD